MITITRYGTYNKRRYGRPWAAIVTLGQDGRPSYDFRAGYYAGTDDGGELMINAKPGDVIAYGQKDHRGNGSSHEWMQVNDDSSVTEISRADGLRMLTEKK